MSDPVPNPRTLSAAPRDEEVTRENGSSAPTLSAISLVVLAVAVAYTNSLTNGFAFDDEFIIVNNPRVHQLTDLASIWLTPYWPGFGADAGLYRPFTIFAYALQWSLGSGGPFVFHATNVLLHALASVLALVVLRRFLPALPALLGALVFAVHPVHAEAVANVVGQAELLAGVATLGACVVHFRRGSGRSDTARGYFARVVLIALLYALAMLAKESAIVLPALLLAGDAALGRWRFAWDRAKEYVRDAGRTIAFLVLVACAYLMLRVTVLGSIAGSDAAPSLPFLRTGQRLFVALQTWPEYLRLLVFPLDLSADYSPDVIVPASGFTPAVIAGILLLAGTLALALQVFSRVESRRIAGFAAAWFFIAILPVSNLLLPIGVVLAERTLYTPSLALSIGAGLALTLIRPTSLVIRSPSAPPRDNNPLSVRASTVAILILPITLLATRSVLRNKDWNDTPAYWNALIRDHPESYRAQWGAASNLIANGRAEQGLRYMESAVETWPHDPHLLTELGGQYIERGEAARALEVLERAWQLAHRESRLALYLGLASVGARRYDDALEWAGVVTADSARSAPAERAAAHAVRAQALEGLGRRGEAVPAWQTAIQAAPGRSFTYWMMLARAHGRAGDAGRAAEAADTARSLAPDAESATRVDRLKAWIAGECWKESGEATTRDRCGDPLEDWTLVTPNRAIAIQREASAP